MQKKLIIALGVAMLTQNSAHAIDAKYRQKLEQSGCTQVTEAEGCDINKSKAENAAAGFGGEASADPVSAANQTRYAKRRTVGRERHVRGQGRDHSRR